MFYFILFVDDTSPCTFLREARKITNKLLMSRNLMFLKVDQKLCLGRKKLKCSYFKADVFLLFKILLKKNVLLIVKVGFKMIFIYSSVSFYIPSDSNCICYTSHMDKNEYLNNMLF